MSEREKTKVLLSARNVVKRFGGLTAVKNVSLEVRAGEIVGCLRKKDGFRWQQGNAT